MSYILDALRKSDQQRARGAAPTLLAGQVTAIAPKPNFSPGYGALAVALVAAGIFIGWLRPWQPEPVTHVAAPVLATPPESSPRQNAALPAAPAIAQAAEPPLPKPAPATQPMPAPAAMKADGRARADPEPPRVPQRTPEPIKMPPPAGVTPAAPAPISMAELPIAIQQELPPMSVSVHAYSGKPRERLVGINNQLLREGDSPAPGLKLEQITPDGMVFSYKGYSFRRGVQ